MSERMGNGAIQIMITVYPSTKPGDKSRYDNSVTRSIDISQLGNFGEMVRLAYDAGQMVTSCIGAMVGTLVQREEAAAKAAAEAAAAEAEQPAGEGDQVEYVIVVDNTGDPGPAISSNHVEAWA